MPLSRFHPAVRSWFEERFREPTPPQRAGWEAIRRGEHTLIAAPTGSGKTLAAFLHALDALLREGVAGGATTRRSGESPVASGPPAADAGGDRVPGDPDGLPLPDETRVVYVSPLKALSADIHRNLAEPRREIRQVAEAMGLPRVRITAAVRSGDTTQAERQAMVRTPPHILVTTPESLYLLLTARRSREMLRTVRTVIVDEIHAVVESRRGSHLALSLERLEHVAGRPLQRIGLSATQRPIEEVARFLVGGRNVRADGTPECTIVDEGHLRELELGLELPSSPLEAVVAHEVWEEIFDRLAELIGEHRTTLVFVNTRRMAERVARMLSERVGEEAVMAHHGSLSKEVRLDAESRLKEGRLRALVATASLELGIDIGHVDLVCQLGSPNRITAFLQRVGRSGHTVVGTPKGRLFPLSRDDLIECAALQRAARTGTLDHLILLERPLDVLAQQVVAEVAAEEWEETGLFELLRGAYPYRELARETFDEIVHMLAHGFRTRRGRRGAYVHHDAVNGRLRPRRGARLAAITSGGAIPDQADFRVILEPEATYIGTLNEDFAVESSRGDIFQLGNSSWEILKVETGVVRVADAHGQPPTIPFWFGEAPARSDELSAEVAGLRAEVDRRLGAAGRAAAEECAAWLRSEYGIPPAAADQIVTYLADAKHLLGVLPSLETLVLERFFDEAGGMQLVLHSPYGSRVNRAWGLALRKRFCRSFNFELQAAATENGLLLSLGPQHSFPLEDVFRFLNPETVRDVLVQAVLDNPLFETRWRWNSTISLAVRRWRGGSRTPPQIQRMEAEDLLASVFPDAVACFENIEGGEREIPEHPLVDQAIEDCLTDAMDLERLLKVLRKVRAGELRLVARDTPEPSPLCHELLTARPYAFLDDAPAEERRTLAVYARRAMEPSAANELGALDLAAIERVREEAWPEPRDAEELHDALMVTGFLTEEEGRRGRAGTSWDGWFAELVAAGRATRVRLPPAVLWLAAERLSELRAVHPGARARPDVVPPAAFAAEPASREEAVKQLLRGRTEALGPVTETELGAPLGLDPAETTAALLALEAEGAVLRGSFTPGRGREPGFDSARIGGSGTHPLHVAGPKERTESQPPTREWCDRRLLARIHRYTLARLRSEIEPVTASDFMRFLCAWQRLSGEERGAGLEGLAAVIEQLDGYELPAAAWEPDVLAGRCESYEPEHLDALCLTGRLLWGRLSAPDGDGRNGEADGSRVGEAGPTGRRTGKNSASFGTGPLRSSPVAFLQRERAAAWIELARPAPKWDRLTSYARRVAEILAQRGASFFHELVDGSGLLATRVEMALGELVAHGVATADSFTGLRALLTPSNRRPPVGGAKGRRRGRFAPYGVETAGRWSLLREPPVAEAASTPREGREPGAVGRVPRRAGRRDAAYREAVEAFAVLLLRRYGVVFRRLLARETLAPAWRDLLLVYRRLEARGEIRGGRFVAGFSGEQFALPEAVGKLRGTRRAEPTGRLVTISAADPLNLIGVLTPGDRIPALATNRVVLRDGVPVAAHEAGATRILVHREPPDPREVERALRRRVPPALRWYLWRAG
ncbi:MAG: DEAD/DEAH box helicase [Gemmatimonadota bacterium]